MTYGDMETMYRPGTYWKMNQRVYFPLPNGDKKYGTIAGPDFQCRFGILQKVEWDDGSCGFIYVCHLREAE